MEYLKKNIHPMDLAFRLAEDDGIVLLNGGGFEAPDWSLRVSLANRPDEVYGEIGCGVRPMARFPESGAIAGPVPEIVPEAGASRTALGI